MYQAQNFISVRSAEEAYELLQTDVKNTVLGGGMWMRMGRRSCHTLIDLSRLGLDTVTETESCVEIGAMTTLRQLETSPLLKKTFGDVFADCAAPIVGVQFRNSATVGGSVCGKYGFSDIIPVLLALDGEAVLFGAGAVPMEQFLAKPMGRDLLLSVRLPKDGRRTVYQTARNAATDFGILNVCTARLPDGSWRLAIGARPGPAVRCFEAEAALKAGRVEDVAAALKTVAFGDNLRATKTYRLALAEVFIRRAYDALKGGDAV